MSGTEGKVVDQPKWTEDRKAKLAVHLQIGWRRYSEAFGEVPHGTLPQIKAMLELSKLDEMVEVGNESE